MKKAKPEISLFEAIAAMKGDLEDFRVFWQGKQRTEPVDYSSVQSMEDWEDQFQAWRELRDTL